MTIKQSLNEKKMGKRQKKKKICWGGIWTWRVSIDGEHATSVATKHYTRVRYYEHSVSKYVSRLYDVMSS